MIINDKTIFIWKFTDAPDEYKNLSADGDEDFIIFIPNELLDDNNNIIDSKIESLFEQYSCLGGHDLNTYKVNGGVVKISLFT